MIDLYEEVVKLVSAMDEAQVPYVLVGGLAVSILVEPRATEDIDFLISESDWPAVTGVLHGLGYEPHEQLMTLKKVTIGRAVKLADGDVMVVDFLLAGDEDLGLVRDCISVPTGGTILRVAKPETLVRLKRSRMSEKDRIDIEGLVRVFGKQIDP
jgi:hypothetical protein